MSEKVIWVEDDQYALQHGEIAFRSLGIQVIPVFQATDLEKTLNDHPTVKVVILDIMMSPGRFSLIESRAGFITGLRLADDIKIKYPHISILFYTAYTREEIVHWNEKTRFRIFSKADMGVGDLAREARLAMNGKTKKPRCFIVHGHNETLTWELKDFLQNSMKFPEPIILRQQASTGRTIIEKFEEVAQQIDLAFVLLTPDDITLAHNNSNEQRRRARQNVIFELGYFYSALRRKRGRVILLYQGPCELPSDLSGIIYIDASNGIEAAGEQIRKELAAVLPL